MFPVRAANGAVLPLLCRDPDLAPARKCRIKARQPGDLGRLMAYRRAFRHAYGAFDFALASPNVDLAVGAIARLTEETEGFARRISLLPAG